MVIIMDNKILWTLIKNKLSIFYYYVRTRVHTTYCAYNLDSSPLLPDKSVSRNQDRTVPTGYQETSRFVDVMCITNGVLIILFILLLFFNKFLYCLRQKPLLKTSTIRETHTSITKLNLFHFTNIAFLPI